MSKEFQEHIFEPFAQEFNSARSSFGGTGLGMPIAKSLVETMGGNIEFESEKNVPTGIMASVKGGTWVQENLDVYTNRKFVNSDGTLDLTTNVYLITNYMLIHGLIPNNTYQDFPNLITIYPKEFFCPKSTRGEKEYFTKNTCAIHHFAGSWLSHSEQRKRRIKKLIPVQILKCLHILSRR